MNRFVKQATSLGMSRSEAYKLWTLAVQAKRDKVFNHLLNRIGEGCPWSEIAHASRVHGLEQGQYALLRKRYYAYDPCRVEI
jgi:hypothetical protein